MDRTSEYDKAMNSTIAKPHAKALLTPSFLDYAVHISEKHRCIYVVNPKVACSSIIWTLRRLELQRPEMTPTKVGSIHDRLDSPLKRPSDLGLSAEILADPRFFKFTFVRNPFDRLLSCYLNKIARPTAQREIALRLLGRARNNDEPVSLADFVAIIREQSPVEMDPHWRPQWLQTLQDHVEYDAVGRFEDFDREFQHIGQRISSRFASYVYSERRQATGAKPFHLLTQELAEVVREVYERDFSGFDYPLAIPTTGGPRRQVP